ncbi:hypothetical protein RJ640_029717 [Escallonia rubra]|uniref:CBF1-interacting co-repressor CIR N-terminal domain-containing protein n=1 Tax=Escallonia rubra TaxID=112253 RepID=A0AA88RWH5_9ASTE|nr:hypothetical protein RJ640_029717 [Escallonia rubra]
MALKFLNKKGWHTGNLRNIENVWKAEKKHDAEQKNKPIHIVNTYYCHLRCKPRNRHLPRYGNIVKHIVEIVIMEMRMV